MVGLACTAIAGGADAVLRHESGIGGDEPFYVRMATSPGAPHSFPYAYRVAVPWLVHLLPGPQVVAFQALALLGIGAAAGVLYALLRRFDVGDRLGAALCVGFAISPPLLVVLLRHGRIIDPETVLVMMLGTLFIVRRRTVALTCTLAVGVAVKETSLFLIPFAYAVWARRLVDRRALLDVMRVSAAPVGIYLVLRSAVAAVGSAYTPEIHGSFLQARVDVVRRVFTGVELRRLAYTYGPIWAIAPLALPTVQFARRSLVLVAICVLAMTVSFDGERVIFLAAPAFYVAAAVFLTSRKRLAVATVSTLLLVDLAYALYMQFHGVQHGINASPLAPIPVY
jgi:hypothetical protein